MKRDATNLALESLLKKKKKNLPKYAKHLKVGDEING